MKVLSLKQAKWLIAPLLTVATIGMVWAYYMAIYVPNRIEYFSARNLRILATLGGDVTSTLKIYAEVLRKAQLLESGPRKGEGREQVEERGRQRSLYTIEQSFLSSVTGVQWRTTYTTKSQDPIVRSRPLDLKRSEFDAVLLVDHDGKVRYQHAPAGIQITGVAQLIEWIRHPGAERESGKSQKSLSHEEDEGGVGDETTPAQSDLALPEMSNISDVTIAQQVYKLFLLPVQVPVILDIDSPDAMEGKEGWIIAGLVKKDRFLSECEMISSTVRRFAIALIIVVFVSIPLIRVLTLGKRERVRTLNVIMLAYSLLMGTGLFTLFIADLFIYGRADTRANGEAHRLATDIAAHLREEIQRAYLQLSLLSQQAAVQLEHSKKNNSTFKETVPVIEGPYPFLQMAFWVNPNGDQRVKWFAHSKRTNFISVQDRQYFQQASRNRLWTIDIENMGTKSPARFWVEPIYSWTTTENAATLALPLSDMIPGFDHWVAALQTRFLSVMNPVLPNGFGYAVIDQAGKVLFHSEERRNLREWFVEETDHNRMIEAALTAHNEAEGDGMYWGRDQYFVVKPLEQLPWMVVVFRDKQLLRTADAEGLATATIMLLLYTGVLSALFLAGWGASCFKDGVQKPRATWLWPQPEKRLMYQRLVYGNSGWSVVLGSGIWWGSQWLTIAAGVLVPVLAVSMAVLLWRGCPETALPRRILRGRDYEYAAVSFLIVLSVLPAIAFLKGAHGIECELLLKQAQLSLATRLAERNVPRTTPVQEPSRPAGLEEMVLDRPVRPEVGGGVSTRFVPAYPALGVYSNFFAETEIDVVDAGSIPVDRSSWSERQFQKLIAVFRIPFDELATQSSGLIRNHSGNKAVTWVATSSGQLELYYKPTEQAGHVERVLKLTSNASALFGAGSVFPVTVGIALVSGGLFLIVKRIGEILFGSHLLATHRHRLMENEMQKGNGNTLVLGPEMPDRMTPATSCTLDLESIMVDDAWMKTVRAEIANAHKVSLAFCNWDYQLGSRRRNQQKLQLLRDLLAEGRTVLIQSRTDPTHFKFKGQADVDRERQWVYALRSFARTYPKDDPGDREAFVKLVDQQEELALKHMNAGAQGGPNVRTGISATCRLIREECKATAALQAIGSEIIQRADLVQATREQVLNAVGYAASHHYQQLWATCSQEEQYLLYSLARDGFVLSTRPEVRHLLQRGVLEQAPVLRPMNETFRRWIIAEGRDPTYTESWHKSESEQTGKIGRRVAITALSALGLFLYTTQQEQLGDLMEFVTALFAGIPILAEWLAQLPGSRTAAIGEG